MGLILKEGRKIARTEATVDRVYQGRAAMEAEALRHRNIDMRLDAGS